MSQPGTPSGTQAFTAAALSPAEGHVIFAYAGIAVYDAVMAVRHKYEPFAIRTNAPRGASPEAAVVAAAHRIYEHYLPTQEATILDPAYDASLATIPDGQAKTDGVAVGLRVANAFIALRADDGFREDVGYTPPDPALPGDWVPTAATPPRSGHTSDTCNPSPWSPQTSSDRTDLPSSGAGDGLVSTTRSRRSARGRARLARTGRRRQHCSGQRHRFSSRTCALRGVITQRKLDVVQAARMMAMVSVAYADGIIACFDAKYAYEFWRPITAIREGDTDGNDATVVDPDWMHLLPATPNHPDYPSAHSCITPAGGAALAEFLGTRRIDLTMHSLTGLGDRHFDTVRELTREVGDARIWGGIHFRSAVEDGIRMARQTAAEVLDDNFERTQR